MGNPGNILLTSRICLEYFYQCANYFLSVIIDADPSGNTCHNALFSIGGSTTTSRSWTILVTQYACGDTDSSGYEITFYQFHIQVVVVCKI